MFLVSVCSSRCKIDRLVGFGFVQELQNTYAHHQQQQTAGSIPRQIFQVTAGMRVSTMEKRRRAKKWSVPVLLDGHTSV